MTPNNNIQAPITVARSWRDWGQRVLAYSRKQWLRCLTLVLIGVAVRAPALSGQLLWDDNHLISENPFIRSPLFIGEAFRHHLFPDSVGGHYRPVQTISYVFDYLVWNGDTYGFHLSNVFWHVLGGCLLYKLLRRLLGSIDRKVVTCEDHSDVVPSRVVIDTAAFFGAFLWLVHPVHSAAIDYVSGRADSLACVFACAGWLLYLRGREISRPWLRFAAYAVAALAALFAVCSRESGFLWLLLFLFHLFAFDSKIGLKTKLSVVAWCLVITAAYTGLRPLPPKSAVTAAVATSPQSRPVLMLRALGDYGQLLLWPANLHMERTIESYDTKETTVEWKNAIPIRYLTYAGILFGGVVLLGALRPGRARGIRIFGASWFFLAYLPISNLVQLNATVAEHWLYLPSIGFSVFIVGCALELPRRA